MRYCNNLQCIEIILTGSHSVTCSYVIAASERFKKLHDDGPSMKIEVNNIYPELFFSCSELAMLHTNVVG